VTTLPFPPFHRQLDMKNFIIPTSEYRAARLLGSFTISNILRTSYSPDSAQLLRTPELQPFSNILQRVSEVHSVFLIPMVDQLDKEV